jgi:hypothetical protein
MKERGERNLFGGWEENPKEPGVFRARIVSGPVTPEFKLFSEESRARWDLIEYLKVKYRHFLEERHRLQG